MPWSIYFCQNLLHCQRFLEFLQNFIKFSIQTCSGPLSSLVKPYVPVCWSPETSHAGYPATPRLYQQHVLKDNMKLSWRRTYRLSHEAACMLSPLGSKPVMPHTAGQVIFCLGGSWWWNTDKHINCVHSMRAKSFSAERKGTEQWKSQRDEWGLKTNKGEKWKTTVQQAFSPVYRQNTAALLYCLALLLGPDRPFNAVEPSVRGCHQKKSTGDQRTVGQGRATVRGHNQLEHLELRAGTQKTHTPMLMHEHSYTHVRWPCGGTHEPLFQCICLHMSKQW